MTTLSSLPNRTTSGFLAHFLQTRQLTAPSENQPLYAYKITDHEFGTLKAVLRTCREWNRYASACFVLFAAEWWRRHYEGGSWKWEPILTEINQPTWQPHSKIKKLVQEGYSYWKRPIFQHENGNNDFLGTVFFEAGLPVCLLTTEGYIRTLFLRVFTFLENNRVSQIDAAELISQQAQSLNMPDVLNAPPFFELVHTVVSAFLHLKRSNALDQKEQPLAYLNQYVPDWRNTLPVRLDDGPNASAFIDTLLVDVAKLPRPEPSRLSVTYQLVGQMSDWSVKTVLNISEGLHKPEHLQLAPDAFAGLSATVLIKIVYDGTEKLLGYGYRHGSDQLSIRGLKDVKLPAGIHTTSWQLVFASNQSDYSLITRLPYSEGLDQNLPWVFARQTNDKLLLKGIGSTRLSAEQAWVICPVSFTDECQDGSVVKQGDFSDKQGVYILQSTCLFRDTSEDQSFRIRLSEPQEDQYYFALRSESNSRRINVYPSLNAGIFLGFPRICKIHKSNGWLLYCTDHIQYKTTSGWQSVINPDQLVGCFRIRLTSNDGDVLFSREIAVLPRLFTLSFHTSNHSILFTNTTGMRLSIADQSNATVEKEANSYRVILPVNSQTSDKLKVNMTGLGPRSVTIFVPAQTTAGYFTDNIDQLIKLGQTIDFQQLYGSHLMLNNLTSQEQTRQIILTLVDRYNPNASQIRCEKKVRVSPFSTEEIALVSYKPDIEKLLSFTETVDATVRIQFGSGSGIQIAQYKYNTDYDNMISRISIREDVQNKAGLLIQAFPLDIRFSPDIVINLPTDEASWTFPAGATGKWLYYAGKSSIANIRPKVAVLTADTAYDTPETIDEIHEATHHSFTDRQQVMKDLFDRVAGSFNDINWKTLQELHQCTQHLPLNALDVWKALVKSDQGLVSFFLLFDSLTIGKLSREFSVNWHTIPAAVWLDGFQKYRLYLVAIYSPAITSVIITAKIQELKENFSLECLSQIIQTNLLGEPASQEFLVCQYSQFIQPLINEILFGGVGNPGLIHQMQNRFPVHLSPELIHAFDLLPVPVKTLLPGIPPNFGYIRPVAYLPMLLAYHSIVPNALPVSTWDRHKVRQLIDFDINYGNDIFDWTRIV